jgi:hypothetical protein
MLKPGGAEARPAVLGLAASVAIFLVSILIARVNADAALLSWLLLLPASWLRYRSRQPH